MGSSKPAIAVLPFRNLTDDSGQQYFSDGIPKS
jgi:TolB-like protein